MFNKNNQTIKNKGVNQCFLQNPIAVYLIFQCIIDIVILVTKQETYFVFHLCKLILIVIMMIIQLAAQKFTVEYYLEIIFPFANQILIIITMILLDDRDYFLLLLYANIKISTVKAHIKYVLIQTIAFKIAIVCLVIIFFTEPFLIIISISILCLELFNCVKYVKNTKKTDFNIDSKKVIYELPILSNDDNLKESVRIRENIWKNRIGLLPVSIMLIDKSSLKINYKNITMCQQFLSFYRNQQELEELLMMKLKFTIVKADLDFYQSQCKIDARLRINSNISVSRSHQSDSIEIQKFTLLEIIQKFKEGTYKSLLNQLANSLELNCQHKFDDENELTYSGLIIDNQEDDEFIAVITDITQQKQVQQYIIKDEFKTKIIESFSHELKTPLNSAINFLSASLQHEQIPPQFFNDYIQPAISSLCLQNYLISDVIDFSELNSNNFSLMYTEFRLDDLLEEIQSLFQIQISMKNIGFSIDMTSNYLETFNTDYKRLMQILVNVLQNALKFTSSGSISVKFTSLSANNLQITVIDSGIGMNYTKLSNMKRFIKTILQNEDISSFKNWEGFGLLIGQILLKKLAPHDLQAFNIDSKGSNKGTKITFNIQNHPPQIEKQLTVRQFSRIQEVNLKSYSKSYIVLNSSNDFNHTKSFKQQVENSMESEENVNLSLTQKMQKLELKQPSLITQLQRTSSQQKYVDQNSIQIQHQASVIVSDINCNLNNNKNHNMNNSNQRIIDKQSFEQIRDFNEEAQLINIKNHKKCQCNRMMSVDDEIFNQKSVQLLISKLGFEVILAYNGVQAIEMITNLVKCSQHCQLLQFILMDYQMPIMNGIATTAQLTNMMKSNQLPKIPIIGLTAFTNSADIQNCLEAGMSDVLSKPLKLKELKKILQLI